MKLTAKTKSLLTLATSISLLGLGACHGSPTAVPATTGGAAGTTTTSPAVAAVPTVVSTYPASAAQGVPINMKLSIVFNTPMDPTTINGSTFTVMQGSTPVAGTVTYTGVTAVFTPTAYLATNVPFTATISTGAKTLAGNALASNVSWSFTSGATADTSPPTVSSTFPSNASASIGTRDAITVTFSEAMDPTTLTASSFTLTQAGTAVAGTVTSLGNVATFTPSSPMIPDAAFTATMNAGVKDLAGNALASGSTWNFTTGEAPVVLGAAATFAVLAYSGVSNTGATIINGDLGLSPAAGTMVTGFGPGVVNGTMHLTDPTAAQAKLDLGTGYTDAAGRTYQPVSVSGNLGGMTLTPGIYKSTSGLAVSSGNLTLDAQGDPNAVFIFQMATTFTTSPGLQVILAGGANPANIFWQVGSSATLGSTSVMQGTLMAYQSVTLDTGATLDGRALASNGAVTLDANTVNVPQ